MTILLAKSGYPDQAPRSLAFYQGLHCLPVTLLQVPRLQWGLNAASDQGLHCLHQSSIFVDTSGLI